jgi:IclR family acetate operon transcriptional repressor
MVLIERLDSAHRLRAFLPLGTRLPLHAASNGKAYLASLDDPALDAFLTGDLAAVTERTITDPNALRAEIAEIRRTGYAVTDEELNEGIAAVAVAVRTPASQTACCFSASGPTSRLTPDLYPKYGELALAAKSAIERFFTA